MDFLTLNKPNTRVRFLPSNPLFVAYRYHLLNGQKKIQCGKRKTILGEPPRWTGTCLVCECYDKLHQGNEEDKLKARDIKPYERYSYCVVERSFGSEKPVIMSVSLTFHIHVNDLRMEIQKTEFPDIFDETSGRDLIVVKDEITASNGQRYPNYERSYFDHPTAIEEKTWMRWQQDKPDLNKLFDPYDDQQVSALLWETYSVGMSKRRKRLYRDLDAPWQPSNQLE